MHSALSTQTDALRRFQQHWTSGRRIWVPAGLIVLIAAVATSALLTSADGSPAKEAAAAPARPHYLVPIGALLRDGSLPPPSLVGDAGSVGVPPGTPKSPTTPDPAKAAEQEPAIAAYQGPAGTLTPAGIATLALEQGCRPGAAVIATAIAMAESGGSPSAQGDTGLMTSVWDWSAGLWQIRGLRAERNTGGLRDSIANQGVGHNAAAMRAISRSCTEWTPWSTFNSGAYLRFATLAAQAVRYVVDYYNSHGRHFPAVPAPDPTATIPAPGSGGAPGAAAGAAPGPGADRRSRAAQAAPTGHRTSAPPAASTRSGSARPPQSSATAAPAPTSPARTSASQRGGLPLPLPTTSPPTKITLPPLPSLPLPLPTLPHLP